MRAADSSAGDWRASSHPGARIGIIPARLASTRLPRKLLLAETGKPLIQHTYEAAVAAAVFDLVVIATDSDEIASVARGFGARTLMTSPDCATGTDRVHEAADALDLDDGAIVVNVQGDEPQLTPGILTGLVEALSSELAMRDGGGDFQVATHAFAITREEADDPDLVKVVVAADGRALYFSRSRIPCLRDEATGDSVAAESPWLGHAGIYAFAAEALRRFSRLPPSALERLERLEQLRLLEAGIPVKVVVGEKPGIGIDTRADYDVFVRGERPGDRKREQ